MLHRIQNAPLGVAVARFKKKLFEFPCLCQLLIFLMEERSATQSLALHSTISTPCFAGLSVHRSPNHGMEYILCTNIISAMHERIGRHY